ncbi:hypothetical protein SAMN04487910_1503 [Aquimarina amphilecti]|uniref:Uncharacterized protein n=1 Tax=Aquimarina amphilecti TaxID=1038014 RepID=A0A1H7L228_AQUAM|nr:hypothetical protein [Aquimarina amphilecti]SEK93123.1 hypothetical protein SAMN04487910_1503 [Aquimarina amphilecti]
MKKLAYVQIFSFVLFFLIISCRSKTTERIDITNTLLGNDMYLEVEKKNKNTTHRGIITNSNYGTTHSYSYKLTINNGDINWNGGTAEPKHLLFCKDSTYIHYLKEKYIPIKSKDSVGNIAEENSYYEVQDVFEVYVDKRYFFKLFGDEYWLEISSESYNLQKESCTEYSIPNDNELSLPNTSID